jgi:2,3-diaminopropionate biosynthesis protein SbnA
MSNGILSTIGNTPLIRLHRIFAPHKVHLFGKMEQFNPSGSIKDRPAINIIERGLGSGIIKPTTVVVESSSGNMGIGLAQACAYYGLRFICVVDSKTTIQNLRLLRAFKAEVEVVDTPDPDTGEYLPVRLKRVKHLLAVLEDAFWPDQYSNQLNAEAHYKTMQEINVSLGRRLDFLFCATSTCGTLKGCAEYKRLHHLEVRLIAVDAVGSVIFGGPRVRRLIPGHGAAIVPALYDEGLADEYVRVSDLECVRGCHRLLREEAILAGGSSGATIAALEHFIPRIPRGSTCVAILADRGERYLDTIYSKEWIATNFGIQIADDLAGALASSVGPDG